MKWLKAYQNVHITFIFHIFIRYFISIFSCAMGSIQCCGTEWHSGNLTKNVMKYLTTTERITIRPTMRDWWMEMVINSNRFLFATFKHKTSFLKCQLLELKVEQIPFLIYDILVSVICKLDLQNPRGTGYQLEKMFCRMIEAFTKVNI